MGPHRPGQFNRPSIGMLWTSGCGIGIFMIECKRGRLLVLMKRYVNLGWASFYAYAAKALRQLQAPRTRPEPQSMRRSQSTQLPECSGP